ncbi:MAG: PAS domain S-box protein, partial [Promethearchaeota archaeon]
YQVYSAPYLDLYSDVANTRKSISFETYFQPLDKYFSISVISPKGGEFITAFDDISERKIAEIKMKKQKEDLSTLNRIISLGNESTNLQVFLRKSYGQVLNVTGFDRGGIYLYNSETRHNILVYHKNVHPDFIAAVENIDISEGLFKTIFDKKKPFYIDDFSKFMEGSKSLGVHSAVIVPLRSKDEYIGSLNLGYPKHQRISRDELDLLVAIGKQMGIIIQKFKSEKLLIESEEKFRTLFEKADVGIILSDMETEQIITGNNKICEMLGYNLQDLKRFRLADLHPKEALHYIDEKFEQELNEFSMVNDIPMKKKDGSVFYCNVNSSQIELAGKAYFLAFFRDITNRLEAERELRASEERYRELFESSPVALFENDYSGGKMYIDNLKAAGITNFKQYLNDNPEVIMKCISKSKLVDINKKALDLYGVDNKEKLLKYKAQFEKDLYQNATPDIISINIQELLSFVEGNTTFESEVVTKNFKGDTMYVFVKSMIIPGYEKDWSKVIVSVLDITDRKKTEQKLKESEEKFRTIAEQSLIGIGILQDEELKYVNKRLAAILGYTVDEMKSINFREFLKMVHHDDREKVARQVQRRLNRSRDTITYYQFRVYKKTGEVVWVEIFSKIFNYQGSRASLITFLDITDIRKAELELKESEEKFRTITEQSFMGIIVLQEGVFKYFNKRAAEINGYSIEEIQNWKPNEFSKLIHPDDIEFVMDQARKKQAGDPDVINHHQYRIIKKNGDIIWSRAVIYGYCNSSRWKT